MTESVFESVEKSCRVLRLDFSSAELAILAQELELSPEQLRAVAAVLEHLRQKKVDTTIRITLRMTDGSPVMMEEASRTAASERLEMPFCRKEKTSWDKRSITSTMAGSNSCIRTSSVSNARAMTGTIWLA